jgi:hypothetical protein
LQVPGISIYLGKRPLPSKQLEAKTGHLKKPLKYFAERRIAESFLKAELLKDEVVQHPQVTLPVNFLCLSPIYFTEV